MVVMIYQFLANLGRRLTEWAEAQGDRHERHIIDTIREVWTK